jgi:hypothetical protein
LNGPGLLTSSRPGSRARRPWAPPAAASSRTRLIANRRIHVECSSNAARSAVSLMRFPLTMPPPREVLEKSRSTSAFETNVLDLRGVGVGQDSVRAER